MAPKEVIVRKAKERKHHIKVEATNGEIIKGNGIRVNIEGYIQCLSNIRKGL